MFRIITIVCCWLAASLAVTSVYAQRTGNAEKDAEIADQVVAKKGNVLKIADNAPDQYIVKRGDTLWDIASKFLTDPWRWPEIWRGNRDQVKDPHWIYPGDVLVLDRKTGTVSKRGVGGDSGGVSASGVGSGAEVSAAAGGRIQGDVKLSPTIRSEAVAKPIPVLPASVIEPFLSRPLVLDVRVVEGKIQEAEVLKRAPRVVGSPDDRYVLSAGDQAYVLGIKSDDIDWDVFRAGEPLVDPDTDEILGVEAVFLGKVRVTRRGEPAMVQIRSVKQEILRGDRLMVADRAPVANYELKSPEQEVDARIVGLYDRFSNIQKFGSGGQYSIIAINKGASSGVAVGNVLALYRRVPPIVQKEKKSGAAVRASTSIPGGSVSVSQDGNVGVKVSDERLRASGTIKNEKKPNEIEVPDERYGTVTVFRVADRVSYAIVMEASRPVIPGDALRNP